MNATSALYDEVQELREENERFRAALTKIRDDNYPPSDLEIRDCKQPEMIWQSVARRALETKDTDQ